MLNDRFGADRELPITDTAADPGLFGPDSVTWRVMREPRLILGGGRALLMQAAHPMVAQGAIDHSTYATDPWGRLNRTMEWVTRVCFGTTAEAVRATEFINRLHTRVKGSLPAAHTTARIGTGKRYTAMSPKLLLWVHASFVETMLVSHDAFVGGLTDTDRDTFVREWHAVARLLGVPQSLLWEDAAAMRHYVAAQVTEGEVMPGTGSKLVAQTVLRPPLPNVALRPAFAAAAFMTLGLVPPPVRRGYGVLWTPAHATTHRALSAWMRSERAIPKRLLETPVYDFALARARGELSTA